MNYWFDAFTGTTWDEFQKAGANVSGFRAWNWKRADKIKKGDIFLCYMVGVKRWVGLLEVTSERYRDESAIWHDEVFPVRFKVKPLVMLPPEHGIPMDEMRGKVSFYTLETKPGQWSGWVRSSPTRYTNEDGEVIAAAIRAAQANPVSRPVDPKKFARSPNLYKARKEAGTEEVEAVFSVPSKEEEEEAEVCEPVAPNQPTHTEIQWRLLDLGSRLGLRVWAPKNDRGKAYNGQRLAEVPRLLDSLPTQFDDVTNQTIQNIDVLWLNDNAIVAAFEVEHTTSIYSGLLRMSDLLTMQPNIDITLYLAAPDERFSKFEKEIPRPTFAKRHKPLHTVCGFLPYSKLCQRLDEVKHVMHYLKPEFLEELAEFVDPLEGIDA